MPKALKLHPAERVDLDDLEHGTKTYPRDLVNLRQKHALLDKYARIVSGFQVELADQSVYPGRIVVYAGYALNFDGQQLFNETQLAVSRSVTLEGAGSTFYVEIEFIESESDVDARAFWDPTVDQSPDPDGQEFSNNVSTRTTPDWRIVTPVSVANFDRIGNPDSLKIPLLKLAADGSNVLSPSTNKPRTTVLELFSDGIRIRVQDPTFLINGSTLTIGAAGPKTVGAPPDYETGVINIGSTGGVVAGDIVEMTGGSAPNIIDIENYGPYSRTAAGVVYDYRDRMFQGDELHGMVLARGHGSVTEKSDINLQSLKDHVDFLAGQLQELKWGHANPYISGTDSSREPPGLSSNFPTNPRYFEFASSIQGARSAKITVGTGLATWGDYNASDHTAIQAAITSLPTSSGGTVFIKSGTYTLGSSLTVSKTGDVFLVGEPGTRIVFSAGNKLSISMAAGSRIFIENIVFVGDNASPDGVEIITNPFQAVRMTNCYLYNCKLEINANLGNTSQFVNCDFYADNASMGADPIIEAAGGAFGGLFYYCRFTQSIATAQDGAIIDGSGTYSRDALFSECTFTQTTSNLSSINLSGANSKYNKFVNCKFNVTLGDVVIKQDDGSELKILDCHFENPAVPFLSASSAENIVVQGLASTSSFTSDYVAKFTNCNNIAVKDCYLLMAGGGSALSSTAFHFIVSSDSVFENYEITGNLIEGSSNHLTGIIFQNSSTTGQMQGVTASNNKFDKCECGIYLQGNLSTAFFVNFKINNNIFMDNGVSVSEASYQDVGVLSDGASRVLQIDISNNNFRNFNPTNTNVLYGSVYRAGIALLGSSSTAVTNGTFNSNSIAFVGTSSNRTATADAIYFDQLIDSVIDGNVISSVYGNKVSGINVSYDDEAARVVVSNNQISTINGTSGYDCWGIFFKGIYYSQIVGNVISSVSGAGATDVGAAIGTNSIGSNFLNSMIDSNSINLNSEYMSGIILYRSDIKHSSISGNTIYTSVLNGLELGIYIYADDAAIATKLDICGNTIEKTNNNAIRCAYNGTGRYLQLKISENNCQCSNSSVHAQVYAANGDFTTISNNILRISNGTDRHNILVSDSTHTTIVGNSCQVPGSSSVPNIEVEAGVGASTRYLVNSNMCIGGLAGTSSSSIKTSGSGAAAGTGGLISINVLTMFPDVGAGVDVDVNNMAVP